MMIYHSPKTAEQIESCGIPVFIERSSAESHPLGRLEWVRLYGLMLGKSDEAEKFFSEKCSLLDEVTSRESTGCTAAFSTFRRTAARWCASPETTSQR